MTLDDFLDKLENVRPAGSGYVAICPAHDDGQNSLSVGEGDDSNIIIKCHAGCSAAQVVDAMGLHLRDLFARNSTNLAEPEAVYSYTDEQGIELFQAVRLPGKQFRQRTLDANGEWVWKLEGVRRVLYRLPEVIAGVAAGRTIYITEGEKDAESIRATGRVATCNPMGAGKWRDEFAPFFTGANVIIVADRDEPGRAHAEKVKNSLLQYATAIFVLQAKRGKDVTDHLELGFDLTELVPIRQPPRRGITTAAELAEQGREYLDFREVDLPAYCIVTGLPITLRAGRMYALGAYTGDGKTTLCLQGTRKLCTDGKSGGYFSLEMSSADLRNRLVAHRGVPLHLTENPWLLKADREMLDLYEQALAEIEEWNLDIIFETSTTADLVAETARDREYDFVVVDHIHRGFGDRQRLTEEVQKYTNLALELNIPVILVCQLRKFDRGKGTISYPRPTLQDFRETSQIGDDASMAIAIWRQRDSGGMQYTGGTELIILKNRHRTSYADESGRSYFPTFNPTTGLYTMGGSTDGQGLQDQAPPSTGFESEPEEDGLHGEWATV